MTTQHTMPAKATLDTFSGAQAWIVAHRGILSGSRARGDAAAESDWDYWLPERVIRNQLKPMLNAQGIHWDSCFMGSITWWPDGIQVEVSYLYPRKYPFYGNGEDT